MTETIDVGHRIVKALSKRMHVDVGAAFMSYEQAKSICDSHDVLCDYWMQSKVFVFRKATHRLTKERFIIHTETRSHLHPNPEPQND